MIKGEEDDDHEMIRSCSNNYSNGLERRRKRYPSFKGLAYLASANFLAKGVMLLSSFLDSLFTYEMVEIYRAHLDTHILLFFQSCFAVPVFLLGLFLFLGIEKESFNLVLYPTLMVLFLVLPRYGGEIALIIIHWENHPDLTIALYFAIDLIAIACLLLYVYFCLASRTFGPIPPTPLDPEQQALLRSTVTPTRKAPAPPPPEGESEVTLPVQPPPRPPPSPKFNYKLRRGVGQISVDSPEGAMLEELDKQKQRNSAILMPELEEEAEEELDGKELSPEEKEKKAKTQSLKVYETEPKRKSLLLETDLDAKNEGSSSNKKQNADGTETGVNKKDEAEEDEEEGEWEWEYEEEEEEEPKKEEERDPSPQILSSSFKTTAV